MSWNVTIWDNVDSGRRVMVELDSYSCPLTPEFIEDAGVKAFEIALDRIPEPMMFVYGGRAELAEAMHKLYLERSAVV